VSEQARTRFSLSNLKKVRIDWSLKTPAARIHFVIMIVGELAVGALLIYGAFFLDW
jgi:hypothetical protein